jgi:hypothetical protein
MPIAIEAIVTFRGVNNFMEALLFQTARRAEDVNGKAEWRALVKARGRTGGQAVPVALPAPRARGSKVIGDARA